MPWLGSSVFNNASSHIEVFLYFLDLISNLIVNPPLLFFNPTQNFSMPKLKAILPLFGHLMPAFALFVILFPTACFARHLTNQDCGSTFCENQNISFSLTNLFSCENNNSITLVRRGGKFSVQQIFYENYTIQVLDVSLDMDDCNSLPLSLLS
ncbi:rust resistance kinase Lr10-like [Gossypium australe]|uniref:Rust resistance kinase Lr10-like n=1 Tax=Gossypium australe TaxID=47621 RepID=A0A5B6VFT4_9ROSI|nr:rust resistance kinase Lr10-like [Gossypium australe]